MAFTKRYGYRGRREVGEIEAMQLLSVNPTDDFVGFGDIYDWWSEDIVTPGKVTVQLAKPIDGSDKVYIWIEIGSTKQLVKTGDWIVRTEGGIIGVVSNDLFTTLYRSYI